MEQVCTYCNKAIIGADFPISICQECDIRLDEFDSQLDCGAELRSNCCYAKPVPESCDLDEKVYMRGAFYVYGRCSDCKDPAGFQPVPANKGESTPEATEQPSPYSAT